MLEEGKILGSEMDANRNWQITLCPFYWNPEDQGADDEKTELMKGV
jgi:hypothetical protein